MTAAGMEAVGDCLGALRDWCLQPKLNPTARYRPGASAADTDDDDDNMLVSTPLLTTRKPTLQEELTMSPIQKFFKYRRIPFKLILNVAVVCLITAFMVNDNQQYAAFVNSSSDGFRILLNNDNYDTLQGNTRIYSYAAFQAILSNSTSGYFEYPVTSLFPVTVALSVPMSISYLNGSSEPYELTPGQPLGPFAGPSTDVRALLNDVLSITIDYSFATVQPSYSGSGRYSDLQYTWDCQATYDFTSGGGPILYYVDIYASVQNADHSILMVLDVCIVIVSLLSVYLTIRALRRSFRVYFFAKRALSRAFPPEHEHGEVEPIMWAAVDNHDKLAFFNLWFAGRFTSSSCVIADRHFSTLVSDASLVIGCSMSLQTETGGFTIDRGEIRGETFFLALGLILAWFNLLKYVEWDPKFYMLILAIRASLSKTLRLLITSTPIFVAYTLMGMFLFSDLNDLFGDFSLSASTLFALLNGDSVLLIFQAIQRNSSASLRLFGQLYLYSFSIFFIVIIFNIFIFIIEAGYHAAKELSGPSAPLVLGTFLYLTLYLLIMSLQIRRG